MNPSANPTVSTTSAPSSHRPMEWPATRGYDVVGMFIHIHANGPDDVHEPVPQRDLVLGLDDLVDMAVELPVEQDVDGHATEAWIVVLVGHAGDGCLTGFGQFESGSRSHAHSGPHPGPHSARRGAALGIPLGRRPGPGEFQAPRHHALGRPGGRIEHPALIVALQDTAICKNDGPESAGVRLAHSLIPGNGDRPANGEQVLRPPGAAQQGTGLQLATPRRNRAVGFGDVEVNIAVRIDETNVGDRAGDLQGLGGIELPRPVMSMHQRWHRQPDCAAKVSHLNLLFWGRLCTTPQAPARHAGRAAFILFDPLPHPPIQSTRRALTPRNRYYRSHVARM